MQPSRKALKNLTSKAIPSLGTKLRDQEQSPRIVVLINWENMGDFVLFTAVIREVKLNFPESKLFVVAQKENRELADLCPYVEKWIWIKGHKKTKPGMGHGTQTSYWRKFLVTYFFLLLHGRRKIDLLFGPDWLLVKNQEQLMSNMLFQKANRNNKNLIEINSKNLGLFKDKSHQVIRTLSILEMFGMKVGSDEIENWISTQLPKSKIDVVKPQQFKSTKILISLGAGQARRNWPIEYVKRLVVALQTQFPDSEILVLGPKSLETLETIQAFPDSTKVKNLIGKTDLSMVASLMQSSDLLISNDSGLVHIAASLKLPCVIVSAHPINADPWHLHSPNRYHPWKTEYRVIQPQVLLDKCLGSCQATSPHCIKSITPTEVLEACNSLLTRNIP